MTGKDLVFLLFTGKWEAYPEGGAKINGIDKCATSAPPWASHATQKSPAPAQRYNQGKEFHQLSVPQPGGGRRLRTFKNPNEAKRFMQPFRSNLASETEFVYKAILSRCSPWIRERVENQNANGGAQSNSGISRVSSILAENRPP